MLLLWQCASRAAFAADEMGARRRREILRLRGPTRSRNERGRKKSVRSAQNDRFGVVRGSANPSPLLGVNPSGLRINGSVGVLDGRGEFAGGEGVEATETGLEFGGGEAAIAIERAEKVGGGLLSFLRIAFEAAGNQVAVGVAAGLDAGLDVVEALGVRVGAAQAVKALSAFAEVDGVAQGAGLEEVEFFEVNGRELVGKSARVERSGEAGGGKRVHGIVHSGRVGISREDFFGEAHFENVAGFAALDDAERAKGHETAHGFTDRASADTDAPSEPGHGAVELELAFEARVAEEIEIDGALGDGEAQARVEKVSELHPEKFEVQFFGLHGWAPRESKS